MSTSSYKITFTVRRITRAQLGLLLAEVQAITGIKCTSQQLPPPISPPEKPT